MLASKTVIVIALSLLGLTSAQLVFQGACPENVNVVPNFNVEEYLGTWFEYAKYPISFETNGKCVTAKYTLQADGNVGVTNSMINDKTGAFGDIVGSAKLESNAKLIVSFPTSPSNTVNSNYWVLDTDYTSYSVVYSYQPISPSEHSTFVWILTRERVPSVELINRATEVLVQNNIPTDKLVITNQADCTLNEPAKPKCHSERL